MYLNHIIILSVTLLTSISNVIFGQEHTKALNFKQGHLNLTSEVGFVQQNQKSIFSTSELKIYKGQELIEFYTANYDDILFSAKNDTLKLKIGIELPLPDSPNYRVIYPIEDQFFFTNYQLYKLRNKLNLNLGYTSTHIDSLVNEIKLKLPLIKQPSTFQEDVSPELYRYVDQLFVMSLTGSADASEILNNFSFYYKGIIGVEIAEKIDLYKKLLMPERLIKLD